MSAGRIVSASAAVLAVAGCTALVIGVVRIESRATASPSPSPTPTSAGRSARPASPPDGYEYGYAAGLSAPTTGASTPPATRLATTAAPGPSATPPRATVTATSPRHSATPPPVVQAAPPATSPAAASPAPVVPAPARGQALPLSFGTGNATRVITVTAGSTSSTTATLQAWTKAPAGGWFRYGSPVTAHIGSDGMTWRPSESLSATPIGSFTLTQAFGYDGNPGTGLPYFQTTPDDYWISDLGPLYNTHQRCGGCGYDDGVNEHLYYERPYYAYAVVIDYNTRNAPGGVRQGAGSAFFLHVTDGTPTAGCVAIPQSRLLPLMRWLTPGAHPRILIGVV